MHFKFVNINGFCISLSVSYVNVFVFQLAFTFHIL